MSLKDRLGRLTGETVKPFQADPVQDTISELRRRIDQIMSRRERIVPPGISKTRRSGVLLEHVVAGEEAQTAYGTFFLSHSTLNADEVHGHARICDFACLNMEATAFLARPSMSKDMAIEDGLFLDTETTGLAGGTGTFPAATVRAPSASRWYSHRSKFLIGRGCLFATPRSGTRLSRK